MRMHFQQPQALALGVDTKRGTEHDRHAATSCFDCAARCPVAEIVDMCPELVEGHASTSSARNNKLFL
jgi:hypothetical protein